MVYYSKGKKLLLPLSWVYSAVMNLRNYLYDHRIFRRETVDVPVISVGNINVGGTGKTPLAETIAKTLIDEGYTTCVLSRGYRRESTGMVIVSRGNGPEVPVAEAGDEPFMLATLIPELQVVVNSNRVEAAQYAIQEMKADVLLLDDGFQHRSIARDLDIVLVPADEVLRKEPVLPAGKLREPWKGLRRASHILITDISNDVDTNTIIDRVKYWSAAKIHIAQKTSLAEFHSPVKDEILSIEQFSTAPKVFAVAGIGNPDQFRQGLENAGAALVGFKTYPDHFAYPLETQILLIEEFKKSGADYLIMTAKDYVKWSRNYLEEFPIFYLPVIYKFDSSFLRKILTTIKVLTRESS